MRSRAFAYLALPVAAVVVFFFVPLATMAWQSVAGADGGLTPAYYARFFGDSYYLEALAVTVGTGLVVALLTMAVSYPVAYLYSRSGGGLRSILTILLLSPFYANVVVKVFGWMVLLSPAGLVNAALVSLGVIDAPADLLNGYLALVVVSVHRAMPFMVLLIASAMANIEREVLEAARICGASSTKVVRSVVLPLSMPGALAGAILVFSLTVAAYVVPVLVGGRVGGRFLPVLMYQQIAIAQNWPFGSAIGVILLVAALGAVAVGNRVVRSIRLGRVMGEGFAG